MINRRRKILDEEEDSQERWLISYADLMTLLFAFFVVMYATSTINLNKYRALSNAVTHAFQGGTASDGRLTDGRLTDGRLTDGRLTDGRLTDGRLTDGRLTDGRLTDGRLTDGRAKDGRPVDGMSMDGRPTANTPASTAAADNKPGQATTPGPAPAASADATVSNPTASPDTPAQTGANASSVVKPLPLSYLYQERRLRNLERLRQLGQQLANQFATHIEQKTLRVSVNPRGVRLDISDQLLFSTRALELLPEARPLLNQLASSLKSEQCLLQVEGHGARATVSGLPLHSAWEVSALKAARLARALIMAGMPETALKSSGLAYTQPLSSSENAIAHAENQRISLWIVTADDPAMIAPDASQDSVVYPQAAP